MAFVDNLLYQLFAVGSVGVLTFYIALSVYLAYRRSSRKGSRVDITGILEGGMVPLTIIAVYLLISGVVGQLLWPLPGAYNILFYDPMISLALVLLGFSWCVYKSKKLHYVGLFALLTGILTGVYGITGYMLGFTKSPIALLGMFGSFGIAGILAFPMALMVDGGSAAMARRKNFWLAVVILFLLFLAIGTVIAFLLAQQSIYPHLSSPP